MVHINFHIILRLLTMKEAALGKTNLGSSGKGHRLHHHGWREVREIVNVQLIKIYVYVLFIIKHSRLCILIFISTNNEETALEDSKHTYMVTDIVHVQHYKVHVQFIIKKDKY